MNDNIIKNINIKENIDYTVSIICLVYNHEKYIRDALEGFLKQKTNFNYEIVIHDDASTDRSASIIREYTSKYPEKIIAKIQTENQYSKGVNISEIFIYPLCRGKYIAICEGDDYWTDPYKLQKQYDVLEKHIDVDMCAHSADMIDAVSNKKRRVISPKNFECVIPTDEVIAGGGGLVATNSLFFRKEIGTVILPFMKKIHIDYVLQISGSLRGGIYFLPDVMSVYRSGVPNSWTERIVKDKVKLLNHLHSIIEMLLVLDKYTKGNYSDVIKKTITLCWFDYYCTINEERKLLNKKYEECRRSLSWKRKILFYSAIVSPKFKNWLLKAIQKIKYEFI